MHHSTFADIVRKHGLQAVASYPCVNGNREKGPQKLPGRLPLGDWLPHVRIYAEFQEHADVPVHIDSLFLRVTGIKGSDGRH